MLAYAMAVSFSAVTPVGAEDTPLAKEMDELSGSLKGLRKAETIEEKVKLVQVAQAATLNSAKYLPVIFKDLTDEKEKATSTADYKRLIGLSYTALCELELAFLNGDEEKAGELIDHLKTLKKEAHRKYTD